MDMAISGVQVSVCLFVCLSVFRHDISKTDLPRIIKLDLGMVHHESWKPIYCGVKMSKVKVTRHKKHCRRVSRRCCECWLRLVTLTTSAYVAINYENRQSVASRAACHPTLANHLARCGGCPWREGGGHVTVVGGQVGTVSQEFYKASDLKIGACVNVWGRNFLLCDCDAFTKEYYRVKFGISK